MCKIICLPPPLLSSAFSQISFLSRRTLVLSCRTNLAQLMSVFHARYFASSSSLPPASPLVLHRRPRWIPRLPSVFVLSLFSQLTSDTKESFLCKETGLCGEKRFLCCKKKCIRSIRIGVNVLLTEAEPNLIWIPFFCSLPVFFPKPNANFCFFESDWSQSSVSLRSSALSGERSLPLSSSLLSSVL